MSWSGGQVVRAVKVFMMARVVQVVQDQDQVNNPNSAFILINRLISRGFQSGWIGPSGPGGPGGPWGPGGPGGLDGQGGQVVRRLGWSGGQLVRCSCGQVVQVVRW